jgi:cyclophilin family peptidyl-prolyl cis-trans isomerase/HEAT repeat protein
MSAPAARAQDPAVIEGAAAILQAEDSRVFDPLVLASAARHAAPLVRSMAALGMGRIGDARALDLLLELLRDPDSTVTRDAAFALGLLREPGALPALRDLVVTVPPEQQHETHAEAMTAVLKIGGDVAVGVLVETLTPWAPRAATAVPPLVVEVGLGQAWRLGALAPVGPLVEFAVSPSPRARTAALYTLARLRAPGGADVLLDAIESPDPDIRKVAVRALTAQYADTVGLDRSALAARVRRLVGDDDPHIRTDALRALGTFRDSSLVPAVVDRLSDADPNVRVQALLTLADLGGSAAAAALAEHVERQPYAVQRAALVGLARVAGIGALDPVAKWLADPDWMLRSAGAEALGHITRDTVVPWLVYLTQDKDARVASVALTSLAAVAPDTATVWSRQLIAHQDPVVRTIAADRLAAAANPADIDRLVSAYGRSLRDPIPDARIAIVGALGRIAELGLAERLAVEDRFLDVHPTSGDYLVRRAAQTRYPEAARRWGPERPIATGRTIEDYRAIARRFVAPESGTTQTLIIDTDRGRIVLDLFGRSAPITVNAFLQLVDQRVFDGRTFHRVVPNFLVQGGDPRGDGWGGPGFALRDEINRVRYERGTVGMALSGPDTGGSQFFITHSPQPHLDGTYPVIGRVISGMDVIDLITRGDRIQSIRRQ